MLNLVPHRWRHCARDDRGIALVEFALTLPLVVALGVGGIELAHFALTSLRVNQIALAVADNAGRVTQRMTEADIEEVFLGARITGQPIDFEENGRIVLSSLQHNGLDDDEEGQMINWQRCWGDLDIDPMYGEENDGETDDSLQGMGPADRQITALENSAVMFVEVSYQYQPLIGGIRPRTIRYESAFIVRSRTEHDTQGTPVHTCA